MFINHFGLLASRLLVHELIRVASQNMAYIRMKAHSVIIPILLLHINENWILLSVLSYSFYMRHPRPCFEIWWQNRMGKISWTDRVKSEEVLHRVNKGRNIIQTIKRRKVSWIGHILRRNCLLNMLLKERQSEEQM